MHELSIAQSLIDVACEAVAESPKRIRKLNIRIGRLSGVVTDALLFSFELAAVGTPCEGATLDVEDVPISVYCEQCQTTEVLESASYFACPKCGKLSSDIRSGRELELISLEVDSHETSRP